MTTSVLKRGQRKHEQIFQAIREEIVTGTLDVGVSLASEAELCERFEVSRGPVRQALAELQRQGLVRRHPGKGSFVARREVLTDAAWGGAALATEPETEVRQVLALINAFGVIPGNFLAYEMVEGLSRAMEEMGENYRLNFQFHRGVGSLTPQMVADCHGMIVAPFSHDAVNMFSGLIEQMTMPAVSIYNRLPNDGIGQFYIDHEAGACDATELLVRYGHRRLAMITEPSISPGPAAMQRERGFIQVTEAAGLTGTAAAIVKVGMDPLVRVGNIERLLRQPDRPTALVIAGGVLTPMVLEAVRSVGLRVPEDISVIAFDDTPEAALNRPRLAVVKMPLGRLTRLAVELLVMQIEGQARPDDCLATPVKPDLLMAESVGPAPDS